MPLHICQTVLTGTSKFKRKLDYPSSHPFSAAYPGPGRGGSRLSKVVQTEL